MPKVNTDDQRLSQYPVFLMEIIIKQFREIAKRRLKESGATINVDQWLILKQISENAGSNQVDIGKYTIKDGPAMTRIIDALVQKKLIKKQLDPNDRRSYQVSINQNGRDLMKRLGPIVKAYRQIPLKGFTELEKKTLVDLLNKMLRNF